MTTVEPEIPMVTITTILNISPIEDADLIELAEVYGWNVVVKKSDNFKPGDRCAYAMIGSVFPPEFAHTNFLEGKALKTKKIRGVFSQGLVFPIQWVIEEKGIDCSEFNEGDDVTKIIGVRKWVPNEEMTQYEHKQGAPKAYTFPSYVPKTDEARIQGRPKYIKEIQGQQIVVSRKEDGCSMTVLYIKPIVKSLVEPLAEPPAEPSVEPLVEPSVEPSAESSVESLVEPSVESLIEPSVEPLTESLIEPSVESLAESTSESSAELSTESLVDPNFMICSRNFKLTEPDPNNQHYYHVVKKFAIEEKLTGYGKSIAIQGEIVGPKINKNKLKLPELDFRVFSIFDIESQSYVSQTEMMDLCNHLGLHTVPILYIGLPDERFQSVQSIVEYTNKLEYSPKNPAEGIVVRVDKRSPRISFKVISNEYLVKNNL